MKKSEEIRKDVKEISIDSMIQLKGKVKAIFQDTIHVQIGEKIISLPASVINSAK